MVVEVVNNFYPKSLCMSYFFRTFRVDEGGSVNIT